MMKAFQQRRWALVILWVLIIAAIVAAPSVLPVFRLNLLGRFLALAIVALGIDLIWGFTGLLSLGQGIFFALGGYVAAMYLQLNSSGDLPNGIPEFFSLYGVDRLPAFWQPFIPHGSPWWLFGWFQLFWQLYLATLSFAIALKGSISRSSRRRRCWCFSISSMVSRS